jgi:hypothetical protein
MDAIEGRKIATWDIPGAFLQADWPADRDCYLKFEGAMVSMICDIDSNHSKNIVYGKNGRKFIYAKLTAFNSFHVMAPILAPLLGVLFLRGHIFLKNRT